MEGIVKYFIKRVAEYGASFVHHGSKEAVSVSHLLPCLTGG